MKPTPFKSKTTPWRVQIPGRYFADSQRKAKYFTTLIQAEKFVYDFKKYGALTLEEEPWKLAEFKSHGILIPDETQNSNFSQKRFDPLIWKEDKRRLIPLKEIADLLGLPTRTIRRYSLNGSLPRPIRFGPRQHWYFERYELRAWWENFIK